MANQSNLVEERIRRYFTSKARQLAEMAQNAICDHSGLAGSYREELQRLYLKDVLPKRFGVGRGMIYGQFHRSKEVDVVIWDEANYSRLPIGEHSWFFPESVRVALECKSTWSMAEFEDVLAKSRAVRDIIGIHGPSLLDEIEHIESRLIALERSKSYQGTISVPHHIGTAAIFLQGGQSFSLENVARTIIADIDDSWPDLLLLLEAGKVIIKNYNQDGSFAGGGWLDLFDVGEDSLLVFTNGLISLVQERSVLVEPQSRLPLYTPDLAQVDPISQFFFNLTRPPAQRTPLWR